VLVAAVLWIGSARSADYVNYEYKLVVALPDGLAICTTPAPGPNHGFTVLIDSKDCDNVGEADVEQISIYTGFNIPEEEMSARELGKHFCDGAPIRKSSVSVDRLPFFRCGPTKDGALARVQFIALRPMPNEWSAGWIQIIATLYCRPQRAAACERQLRDLLHRMRLTD
jgi:hypothetical protein